MPIYYRNKIYTENDSINDGLLHASIFKKNPVLGYMHMSLAFGWFLLIVIGHLEVVVAKGGLNFPFYYAIFFRYFEPVHATTIAKIFAAVMDFLTITPILQILSMLM